MATSLEHTRYKPFVWYAAFQAPPRLFTEENDRYELILSLSTGLASGFYSETEKCFYKHCERYDNLEDEPIPGLTREEQINNHLDWTIEVADDVNYWMIITTPPKEPWPPQTYPKFQSN